MTIRASTDLDVLSVTPEPFDHVNQKTAFLCIDPAEPRLYVTDISGDAVYWPWVAKFSADVNGAALARCMRSMPFLTALNSFCDRPSTSTLAAIEQQLRGIESTSPNLLMQWMQDNLIRIDASGVPIVKGVEGVEEQFYVMGAGVLHANSSDRELAGLVERVASFMAGSEDATMGLVASFFEQLREELRGGQVKPECQPDEDPVEGMQMALL